MTSEEAHSEICEHAASLANRWLDEDPRIPNRWKGRILENASPYTTERVQAGNLSLRITEAYQSAPEGIRTKYRQYATRAIRQALADKQELWVGVILGEARLGRNYFHRWSQSPTTLF